MLHRAGEIDISVPRAAVHLIRADGGAHELLEQILLLVGAPGGDQPGDGVRPMLGLDRGQSVLDEMDRLIPGLRNKALLSPNEWRAQPLFAVDILKPESSEHAEAAMALHCVRAVAPFVFP